MTELIVAVTTLAFGLLSFFSKSADKEMALDSFLCLGFFIALLPRAFTLAVSLSLLFLFIIFMNWRTIKRSRREVFFLKKKNQAWRLLSGFAATALVSSFAYLTQTHGSELAQGSFTPDEVLNISIGIFVFVVFLRRKEPWKN